MELKTAFLIETTDWEHSVVHEPHVVKPECYKWTQCNVLSPRRHQPERYGEVLRATVATKLSWIFASYPWQIISSYWTHCLSPSNQLNSLKLSENITNICVSFSRAGYSVCFLLLASGFCSLSKSVRFFQVEAGKRLCDMPVPGSCVN